jgi:hypothetical protein
MKSASFIFAIGLTLSGGILSAMGCSDETGGTSSTNSTQSTTSSTTGSTTSASSTGTGAGGEGGEGTGGMGTGGMGAGGAPSTSSSSSGAGGSGEYATCSDCTDTTNGAPAKECGAKLTACMNNPECAAIYNCAFNTCPSGKQEGACCSIGCEKSTNAQQGAITLYRAYDSCVYCQTCKSLCDADFELTAYCKVFEPGGDSVCAN